MGNSTSLGVSKHGTLQRPMPEAGIHELAGAENERNTVYRRGDSLDLAKFKWFGEGTERTLAQKRRNYEDLKAGDSHGPVFGEVDEKKAKVHFVEDEEFDRIDRAESLRGVVERDSWEGTDARWVAGEMGRLA